MALFPQLWAALALALLCAPAALFFAAGLVAARLARGAWPIALLAGTCATLLATAGLIRALISAATRPASIVAMGAWGPIVLSFRSDVAEALMLQLVTFLGWVIVHYSCRYMAGDPREPRFLRKLMYTLAAVCLLVVTNNLLVFLAAWVLTSLSLHGLLTLYPERQPAVIAAHKKFLASRLGDLTLFLGILLLGTHTGSFEMDQVLARIAGLPFPPAWLTAAAVMLSLSAIIKCAQLPLHGWLIQVMEAPTPVSALLHAGVVNLGGFMLIRLAPVFAMAPGARLLLVISGTLTAVISSLVMTTRISIKVHLAWSTCAQMGFMLLECGLGRYDLALLHLLGHSLYKAHAFLGSGGTVNLARLKAMTPTRPRTGTGAAALSACCGLLIAGLGAILWQQSAPWRGTSLFCLGVSGLAVAGLLASTAAVGSPRAWFTLPAIALLVVSLYFGAERLFHGLLPNAPALAPAWQDRLALVFAVAAFFALYAVQTVVRARPRGRFVSAAYPWFYAGLYLDELFTRATFSLWPARQTGACPLRRDAAQALEPMGVTR